MNRWCNKAVSDQGLQSNLMHRQVHRVDDDGRRPAPDGDLAGRAPRRELRARAVRRRAHPLGRRLRAGDLQLGRRPRRHRRLRPQDRLPAPGEVSLRPGGTENTPQLLCIFKSWIHCLLRFGAFNRLSSSQGKFG